MAMRKQGVVKCREQVLIIEELSVDGGVEVGCLDIEVVHDLRPRKGITRKLLSAGGRSRSEVGHISMGHGVTLYEMQPDPARSIGINHHLHCRGTGFVAVPLARTPVGARVAGCARSLRRQTQLIEFTRVAVVRE